MVLWKEKSKDGLTVVNDSNQFHDDEDFGTFDFKRNKHVFCILFNNQQTQQQLTVSWTKIRKGAI